MTDTVTPTSPTHEYSRAVTALFSLELERNCRLSSNYIRSTKYCLSENASLSYIAILNEELDIQDGQFAGNAPHLTGKSCFDVSVVNSSSDARSPTTTRGDALDGWFGGVIGSEEFEDDV